VIRAIATLLAHDLAVAFKNKTIHLVICIPLFVYATLTLVDPSKAGAARMNIALLKTEPYAPVVLESIMAARDQFAVRWVADAAEATRLLKARKIDGVLTPEGHAAPRLLLTVVQQTSIETVTIVQRLSALQSVAEGKGPGWIAAIRTLQASSLKRQTLPIWILMMVLLVGFIVLPAEVAEEKEKQLLLGWLQTPVRESQWLASKLTYGIALMLLSVAVLQWLSAGPARAQALRYLALLGAGGFCFGALGICLGLLCRSQASARTLGVLCYLPLLLPVALSDMSPALRRIAPLVPSYYFYEPIRAMLLEGSAPGACTRAGVILAAIGLLACLASQRLIKKRWLM